MQAFTLKRTYFNNCQLKRKYSTIATTKGRNEIPTVVGKLEIGHSFELTKQFSTEDVTTFAKISLDNNPVHLNAEFAETTIFKKPIVHGILSASLISAALATNIPGAIYLNQSFKFIKPVCIHINVLQKYFTF
jgi:acyl dehydratase